AAAACISALRRNPFSNIHGLGTSISTIFSKCTHHVKVHYSGTGLLCDEEHRILLSITVNIMREFVAEVTDSGEPISSKVGAGHRRAIHKSDRLATYPKHCFAEVTRQTLALLLGINIGVKSVKAANEDRNHHCYGNK